MLGSSCWKLPIRRYPSRQLLERVFELRNNLTAYDAAYVALAEALDAPLVTTDDRLARSTGHTAEIPHAGVTRLGATCAANGFPDRPARPLRGAARLQAYSGRKPAV